MGVAYCMCIEALKEEHECYLKSSYTSNELKNKVILYLVLFNIPELEIVVSHCPFPTNFPHLAEQIRFARPNLLYISNGIPLIVYCNVPAFKEWPTNFKLLFQALIHYS